MPFDIKTLQRLQRFTEDFEPITAAAAAMMAALQADDERTALDRYFDLCRKAAAVGLPEPPAKEDYAGMHAWKRAFRRWFERVRGTTDAMIAELRRAAPSDAASSGEVRPTAETNRLALADGGFTLSGKFQSLIGRPRQMLKVLLESRHNSATSRTLRSKMGVNDLDVDHPEQVIRDAAKYLRKALRKAAGKGNDYDPIPSAGSGDDLAYRLDQPLLMEFPNRPE
jgi:hypothetical protein